MWWMMRSPSLRSSSLTAGLRWGRRGVRGETPERAIRVRRPTSTAKQALQRAAPEPGARFIRVPELRALNDRVENEAASVAAFGTPDWLGRFSTGALQGPWMELMSTSYRPH